MSFEEPPIIAATPEPPKPERERRSPAGWVAMILLLALYIAGANVRNPEKPGEAADALVATQDVQLKLVTTARQMAGGASRGELNKLIKALQPHKGASVKAARMMLTLDKEAGEPVDKIALATVANDKSELSKAYVQVYGDAKLTLDDAKRIQALAKSTFTDKLTAVHAFEKAGDPSARSKLVNFRQVESILAVSIGAVGLGLVGLVVVVAYAILRGINAIKPRGFPIGEVTGAVADRLAGRMGIYLMAFIGLQIAVAALARHVLSDVGASVLSLVLTFVAVVALLRVPLFGVADSYKRMVGDTSHWLRHIGIGLLAFCANIPLAIIAVVAINSLFPNLPTPTHPIQEEMMGAHSMLNIGLVYLTAAVMAPLIEELTFRGMLFPALSRVLKSPTLGVLLAGLLFALMHPQGPLMWGALMVIGCTACVVTRLTGSLIPSMVMHAVHNATVVTIGFLFLR